MELFEPLPESYTPKDPANAKAVALCLMPPEGITLELVVKKETRLYVAWLWRGSDGLAYFSKQPLRGKPFVWAAGNTVEHVLKRNPSLRRLLEEQSNGPA